MSVDYHFVDGDEESAIFSPGYILFYTSFNKWQYTRRPSSPSQFSDSVNLDPSLLEMSTDFPVHTGGWDQPFLLGDFIKNYKTIVTLQM